jgi:hypothetical protein
MGIGEAISVVWLGLGAWVAWKFYRALVRISEELAEIKTILRDTRPGLPSPPSQSP